MTDEDDLRHADEVDALLTLEKNDLQLVMVLLVMIIAVLCIALA